ncbi:MAG: hypothetical protein Q9226_008470 [Calogaya cf. arnoldii]
MDLHVRSKSSTREPDADTTPLPTRSKSPVANERLAVVNRWLDESATEAPWVQFCVTDSQNDGAWRQKHMRRMLDEFSEAEAREVDTGAISSEPRTPDNPRNHLSDRYFDGRRIPSLVTSLKSRYGGSGVSKSSTSYKSSHNEEDKRAAGVLEVLVRRVAEVLEIDEPTDGQDNIPAKESHDSNLSRGGTNTGKAKGKRIASTSNTESNSQDDPQDQIPLPKRLKVARPATSAGGRLFACLFLKRDSSLCQKTHCAGRSTCSVETVIRVGQS